MEKCLHHLASSLPYELTELHSQFGVRVDYTSLVCKTSIDFYQVAFRVQLVRFGLSCLIFQLPQFPPKLFGSVIKV